jgi:cell division septation protein DedD
MRTVQFFIVLLCIFGVPLLTGCGTSDETSTRDQSGGAAQEAGQKTSDQSKSGAARSGDTLSTHQKESSGGTYDPRSSTPSNTGQMPTGKFSVQVGAYKQQENADRVASLAKDRFAMSVYTIPDATGGLVKVFVGNFATKEDARKFRDDMAQKFPLEYKDAWVSENPSK